MIKLEENNMRIILPCILLAALSACKGDAVAQADVGIEVPGAVAAVPGK
jgi:hypothetical protein